MAYSTPRISHNRAIGLSLRTMAFLHIDDYANTPPAHALANRQIIENVTGDTVYGDYSKANSAARIIDAVAAGEVDVAEVKVPSPPGGGRSGWREGTCCMTHGGTDLPLPAPG
jgi:hypothetical protein